MNWVIIPEYISLLFVFIMLFFSRELYTDKTLKTKLFRLFLWYVFFEIIISIISLIAIEYYWIVPGIVNNLIQLLFFLTGPLMSLFFVFYLITVIWEEDKNIKIYFRLAAIPSILYISLVITNPLTGLIYGINENNGFSYGQGFLFSYLPTVLYFSAILFVAWIKRKSLDSFLKKVMIIFPLLSMILIGIQMIFPKVILSSTVAAYCVPFVKTRISESKCA